MGLFEAVSAAFATLPTGGFMPESGSFEGFAAASQWVTVVFMAIAGTSFVLTYRVLVRRQPRVAWRDEEFRLYLALLAAASLVVAAQLWLEDLATGEAAIRHGVFQAVSLMTTTGFLSIDFALWPTLTVMTFVLLMFIGGSAGSTGSSIKVVRHLVLGKSLRRELRQTVHPELVAPVRLNGLVVDERILRAITSFILLYMGVFVAGAGLIAIDGAIQGPDIRPIDTIAAAATTLGNVGPALGAVGPMSSFEPFSDVSSLVDDRADVARTARVDPGAGAAVSPLLARLGGGTHGSPTSPLLRRLGTDIRSWPPGRRSRPPAATRCDP